MAKSSCIVHLHLKSSPSRHRTKLFGQIWLSTRAFGVKVWVWEGSFSVLWARFLKDVTFFPVSRPNWNRHWNVRLACLSSRLVQLPTFNLSWFERKWVSFSLEIAGNNNRPDYLPETVMVADKKKWLKQFISKPKQDRWFCKNLHYSVSITENSTYSISLHKIGGQVYVWLLLINTKGQT
jgi:hypothetical protein